MSDKKILNSKSLKFLETYLNNPSPTGYEWEGQKIWMNYLKPYVDEFITDTYGTAVGVINPEAKFKVVIEGHSDEISWYVNYITENGLIYVIRNGGSDHQVAPSKWVDIHTKKGIVKGVFGWPAIHTRKPGKEEQPSMDTIFIDVGAKDKKEVEKMGVHVGCVITYPDKFHILNKNKFVCRAIDNRAGEKKYTRLVEKYIEKELSAQLKKLTRTEGQILIKLVFRETGETVYDLVKKLRNSLRAFSYNSLAKLFDISIKTEYDPINNEEDAIIEDVLKRAYGNKTIQLDLNQVKK